MNIRAKRTWIFLIVLIVICLMLCLLYNNKGISSLAEAPASVSTEDMFRLQIIRVDLQSKLGEDSIYPEYYTGYLMNKAYGKTDSQSIDMTEKGIINDYAILWYAEQKDIQVSDTELNQQIDLNVEGYESAEEKNSLDIIAKNEGVTFKDVQWGDKKAYHITAIKGKMYDICYNKYINEGKMTSEEAEQQMLKVKEEWGHLVDDANDAFRATDQYAFLLSQFSICRELALNGEQNVEVIKKAGI